MLTKMHFRIDKIWCMYGHEYWWVGGYGVKATVFSFASIFSVIQKENAS